MNSSLGRISVLFLTTVLLTGCGANFTSVYRTADGSRNLVAFTDAKQSATIVQVDRNGVMRACAAKSPDVFAALASSASGSADFAEGAMKLGVGGAGSVSEQAASFGLRTQLTQSQSELLYQLCLQALNGALSGDQLATELHRYQNTMVTMLGIEQLTGYAKPTVVALQANASTGATKELLELVNKVDAARSDESKATAVSESAAADVDKKKQTSDKAKTDAGEKKKEQETALKPLNDAVDAAKKDRDVAKATDAANLGAKQTSLDKALLALENKKKDNEAALKQLKDAEAAAKEALDAAKAASAPDVAEKQNAFDKAAKAVTDKTKEQGAVLEPLEDAVTAATQARDAAKTASSALTARQQALDKAESERNAKSTEQATALKPLNDAATAAEETLKTAQTAKTNADSALAAAAKLRSERESAVQQAKGNLDTSASGSGTTVSYPTGEYFASHSSAAVEIAQIVGEMQRTHLWQSFATDDCLRFLLQDRSRTPGDERWGGEQKAAILDLCMKQIERATQWRFENLYLTFGCNRDGTSCSGRQGDSGSPPALEAAGDVVPRRKVPSPTVPALPVPVPAVPGPGWGRVPPPPPAPAR